MLKVFQSPHPPKLTFTLNMANLCRNDGTLSIFDAPYSRKPKLLAHWINLAQDRNQRRALVKTVMNIWLHKRRTDFVCISHPARQPLKLGANLVRVRLQQLEFQISKELAYLLLCNIGLREMSGNDNEMRKLVK
jgi:hypothetical protein